MKTNNLFPKMIAATALLVALISGTNGKAQIATPYNVQNNTSCNITITWYAADPTCLNVCASGGPIVLTPGANPINVSACGPTPPQPCDFKLSITQMGSTVLPTPINGSAKAGTLANIPSTPGCAGTHILTMSLSSAAIN